MATDHRRVNLRRGTLAPLGPAIGITIVLLVVSLVVGEAVYIDPGYGLLVLKSMLEGGDFNMLVSPDTGDLARDSASFMQWWSPGQYLVPGLFVRLGLNIGQALSAANVVMSIVGLFGWLRLSRAVGATTAVQWIFVTGLASFQAHTLTYRIYTGGEHILFALAPWCLLILLQSQDRRPWQIVLACLVAGGALFFAKLTGLVLFAATVLAIALHRVVSSRRVDASVLAYAVGSGLLLWAFKIFWRSHGSTPADGHGFTPSVEAVLFPMAATAFSGLSLPEFLSWVFLNPSRPIMSDLESTSFILAPVALGLAVWVFLQLRVRHNHTLSIMFLLMGIYGAILCGLYMTGASISFEGRHFRTTGILFLLLALMAAHHAGRRWWLVASLVVAFFGLYGITSYASGARRNARSASYDPVSGVVHEVVKTEALRETRRIVDAAGPDQKAIIVVTTPALGVAFPGQRIIGLHVDFTSLDDLRNFRWTGRSGLVVVLCESRMTSNGKATALLAAFENYPLDSWQESRVGDAVIYHQVSPAP